jgi:hypothetical protein
MLGRVVWITGFPSGIREHTPLALVYAGVKLFCQLEKKMNHRKSFKAVSMRWSTHPK